MKFRLATWIGSIVVSALLLAGCAAQPINLPYKDLSAEEILSASVQILPLNTKGDLNNDEIEELAAILQRVEIINRDDSHDTDGGQAVIFTLMMADGTELTLSCPRDNFININGTGYKLKNGVGHKLNNLGGSIAVNLDHAYDEVFQFAIFPIGTTEETYYFDLRQDGRFTCNFGNRASDDISQRPFFSFPKKSRNTQLSDDDLKILTDMACALEASEYSIAKEFYEDSWVAALLFHGKVYEIDYWHNDGADLFMNLIDKIMELSPIMVDMHGWA